MPNRPAEVAAPMFRSMPRTVLDLGKDPTRSHFFTSGRLTGVQLQRVPELRSCPSCGRPMAKISTSEIYECKGCRVFVTEPH
jgi:hypothetical protein